MTADAVGGVWTYALGLADALAPHGVEVQLATMGRPPDADQRAQLARSAAAGLHESEWALEWEDDPWADVERAGEWLLGLEARLAPDLVHLNGYAHAACRFRAPCVVVAHSDVLSWWRAVQGGPAPRRYDRYRAALAAGLAAADAVAAPTRAMLDDLAREAGYRGGVAIPNAAAPRGPRLPKEPLVLGLGRFWDEAKNVAALERVAPRLPWPVELAGAGTARGRLPEAEVESLRARAAIFAAPARYEPFGLAPLEAALAGCALVLGDIPSLREVWGDAAAFVAPGDDDALVAALRRLAGDDDARAAAAARAGARAREYTPERMAAGYLELYARALRREAA